MLKENIIKLCLWVCVRGLKSTHFGLRTENLCFCWMRKKRIFVVDILFLLFSLTFFDVSRYLTLVHFLFSNYTSFAGRRCALIFLRLDCPARGYMAVWVRDSELCLQRVYTQTQSLLLLTHSHDASTHMNVAWLFTYTAMLLVLSPILRQALMVCTGDIKRKT